MVKKVFEVDGMTCNNCAKHIEDALRRYVNSVKASFVKGTVTVDYNSKKVSKKKIIKKIQEVGYEAVEPKVGKKDKEKSYRVFVGWVVVFVCLFLFIYLLYGFLEGMNLDFPQTGDNVSLILLFLIGILTGFHCVSMCGGFMISYTAKNAVEGYRGVGQHIIYGLSKTVSYTVVGVIFGLVGGVFFFTPALRGGIAIFAGVFMIFYALSMFGFRFFRRFQFNPKFLNKIATSKHSGVFKGPAITGLLNGLFIACGPLQAMYIYATGTGSAIQGGLSLMAFGLGTLPVMFGFGGLTNVISHNATRKILRISGIIVLVLGLIMLNRGLALTGSGYDVKSISARVYQGDSGNLVIENGYQIIKMDVLRRGYFPDSFLLKKGVPVKWEIYGKELTGCNNAIQVPKLGIEFDVKEGKQVVEFTPTEEGVISWSCWMGMIPGNFIVTDDGVATEDDLREATNSLSSGGSCSAGGGGGCGCGG